MPGSFTGLLHGSVRTTERTSVAAVNEGDDVGQRLILQCGPASRKNEGDRAATLRMFCVQGFSVGQAAAKSEEVVRLAVTPIPRPSFCVGDSNHMNPIVAVPENNLKWEFSHAARTMAIVKSNETLRIRLDACKRNVYSDTEFACSSGATFRVPIRRCFQLGGSIWMKTNLHHRHRASRTIERERPPNPR